MKFMKYPIAKWALNATQEITQEMQDMLFEQQGQHKLCEEMTSEEIVASSDERLGPEGDMDLWRLWLAGE